MGMIFFYNSSELLSSIKVTKPVTMCLDVVEQMPMHAWWLEWIVHFKGLSLELQVSEEGHLFRDVSFLSISHKLLFEKKKKKKWLQCISALKQKQVDSTE